MDEFCVSCARNKCVINTPRSYHTTWEGKWDVLSVFSPTIQCFFTEKGRGKRSLNTGRNIAAPSGVASIENKSINIPCDASSFLNHIQLKLRSKVGITASGIYPLTLSSHPFHCLRCDAQVSLAQSKHSQIASAAERIFSTSFFKTNKNSLLPGNCCCLSCHSYSPRIMLYRTHSIIMFLSRTHKHHPGSKQVDLSWEFW